MHWHRFNFPTRHSSPIFFSISIGLNSFHATVTSLSDYRDDEQRICQLFVCIRDNFTTSVALTLTGHLISCSLGSMLIGLTLAVPLDGVIIHQMGYFFINYKRLVDRHTLVYTILVVMVWFLCLSSATRVRWSCLYVYSTKRISNSADCNCSWP